ncbi:hypothetical protein CASFOL_009020 [Castilleja foliolosa]|uniref:Uncharacterized protein n=1 Tax=Castilleja foliolosa TaxID=1961234 RepID=A0ABD3E2P4_9LAMI
MASTKYFCFALVLLAISAHVISSSSAAKGKSPPKRKAADVAVVHVICATSEAIKLDIAADTPQGTITVDPGKEYQINILDKNSNYNMMSYYLNNNYAGVDLYRPARDSGQATIYWKADWWGFSMSYDNVNYKQMVQWESE